MERLIIYNLIKGRMVSKTEKEQFEKELFNSIEKTPDDLELYNKVLIVSLLRKIEFNTNQIRKGIQFFYFLTIICLVLGVIGYIFSFMSK